MAVITMAAEPGCRVEEIARLTAQRLGFELVNDSALRRMMVDEFGSEISLPEKVYSHASSMIVARLAASHHLLVCASGAEYMVAQLPGVLRVFLVAPPGSRIGTLMLEHRLERPAARALLKQLEQEDRAWRRKRFGRGTPPQHLFDLVLNTESLEADQIADLVAHTADVRTLREQGLLPSATEAWMEFQVRLRLARHGITPAGKASLMHKPFAHPSEEIFANLLDFYRIAWEYEAQSFAVQWGKDGKPTEFFTPDFYLPEFDLYLELTTMKQEHVTRKNRKVKLLRTIYPHVNIQVFYQKDFQDLILKYGLAERPLPV